MNRIPNRKKGKNFYTPTKGLPLGSAVVDAYGSTYEVRKDGSIKRFTAKKHCTANKI